MPQSSGIERDDQARTNPRSGLRNGRLVPFLGHGKLDGWKGRVSLRDRVVADAIRHWRSGGDCGGCRAGDPNPPDQAPHVRNFIASVGITIF